jgi:hypothetical protein
MLFGQTLGAQVGSTDKDGQHGKQYKYVSFHFVASPGGHEH